MTATTAPVRAYRVAQAAAALSTSKTVIRRLMASGALRYVQPGGPNTTVLIPVSEVDRLLAAAFEPEPVA